MTRSQLAPLLFVALSILFLLRKRQQQKKVAEREAQLNSHGYVPITMDDAEPDSITQLADTFARLRYGITWAFSIFLIAVVAFLAVKEPLVKWILSGTLVVLALIVMLWTVKQRRS